MSYSPKHAFFKHEKDALFILDGGDYAGYDKESFWRAYFKYGEKMFGKFPIFHTIGNHEYHNHADPQGPHTNAEFYHQSYNIRHGGRLAYSFDCSNVRFVVLNSPDPKDCHGDDPQPNITLTKSQAPWLAAQLDNKMAGTFTIHHHPIYQYGKTGVNPALAPWETLYQAYKISANFSGHVHDYERYSVRGIPYFIVGNAGGKFSNLMAGYPRSRWFEYGDTKQLGYLKVSVDPENNTATAQEIYVAYVTSEYDETATVYDPPIVADSVTFPLSSTLRTLTVVKSGLGKGTVESSPRDGIDCGESCQAKYKQTETVVLRAIPDSNSIFSGWTGACWGHGRKCTVSVDEDITVGAIFETGCEYSFKPEKKTFSPTGGEITLTVTAQGISCPAFDVSNDADWITYTQSEFAGNKGTVTLTVAGNTGSASRTANVFIAGNLFTVNQNAKP